MPDPATALQILGQSLPPSDGGGSNGFGPSPSPNEGPDSSDEDPIAARLAILGRSASSSASPSPDAAVSPSPSQGKISGFAANVGAGANEGIAGWLGAPADIVNTITAPFSAGVNWLDSKFRSAAGLPQLTADQQAELAQRTRMPGGSEDIKTLMGYLPFGGTDPRNVVAADGLDAVARGTGQGIAGTVLPGMAARTLVAGGSTLAPALRMPANSIGNTLLQSFGSGSPGNLAVVGGAGGGGGEFASQQVPEPYKPLANFLGNLAVGGGAGLAYEGSKLLFGAGQRLASNYLAPFTQPGQQRLAGQALVNASSGGRGGLLDSLDEPGAGELVPGSQPTTFQATGDLGIGGLERARSNANPEPFINRRADQNAARLNAIDNLAPPGSAPAAVGEFFKQHLAAMDANNDAAIAQAQGQATNLLGGLGGDLEKNDYGAAARQSLEDAKAAVKQDESAKWRAIDPDGSLAVDVSPVTKAANDIPATMSGSAKPMEGEEAAIFNVAQSYPGVVPFQELGDLRSRVLTQIRTIRPAGESPELRRLTMLRQSIDDAMANGAGQKAASLAPTAQAGGDILSQLQAAPWAQNVPPEQLQQMAALYGARTGAAPEAGVSAPSNGSTVFTPSGRRINVGYQLGDLASANPPITSHNADLQPNPNYPAELQPRDRTRPVSGTQIADIAGNLQPERLGTSNSAAEGAPILGPDNVVESGNARVLALAKAYRENTPQAQAYRAWLESQGIDTKGKAAPILVRRRLTELSPEDRVRFAQEANANTGLSMSSTERAAQDASRLSDKVLSLYQSGADLGTVANSDFVRAFMQSVPDKSEAGAFVTPDRLLSVEGKARIQAALLQKAYDNPGLVRALTETGDENIRSFGGALSDAAGDFAKLRSDIAAGRVEPSMDISKAINEAAGIVQNARAKGVPLRDVVAQRDAFQRMSPATDEILRHAYGDDLSGRVSRVRLADFLRSYVEEAGKQGTESRLFGAPLSPIDVLAAVGKARYGRGTEGLEPVVGSATFAGSGPSGAANGYETRGLGGGAPGAAARGGSGQDRTILPEVPLTATFDEAAASRYRAAADATREKKQTFGTGAVGQVLQSGRNGVPYSVTDSQVAGKFFNKGPKALEDVQSFVRAVGGNARAVDILQDFAANRLRAYAERADGTIDPAKLSKWVSDHYEALRAFPALADKFRDAGAAQQTVDDMIAARARDRDLYQKGAAQNFIGTDPIIAVDRAFRSRDPSATLSQLASAVGSNADAREGLQAAVRDYIKQRYQGNTEAATSGKALLKSDQLQTFIKNNRAALGWVFSKDQLDSMEAVAADLQRANRSIASSKLPGQSNTPQDLAAMGQHEKSGHSMIGGALSHGSDAVMFYILERLGEHLGGGLAGSAAGAGLFVGGKVLQSMRQAGINSVDALVDKALLNPALARALVMKVPAAGASAGGAVSMARSQLVAALQRLAVVGGEHSAEMAASH